MDKATASLSVRVMLPRHIALLMNTNGLLGSANGIVSDDFALRNETILPLGSLDSIADYHKFGLDCKCQFPTCMTRKYIYFAYASFRIDLCFQLIKFFV